MNNSPLLPTLLYLAVAFMLLLLCLATAWPKWVKLVMIGVVTGSYFMAESAFDGMLGWPAATGIPEKFLLLATVVEEPDKDRGSKGAIFIWVNGVENGKPVAEPRAFRLAYDKPLHAILNEAMKKIRQGTSQIGSTELPAGGKNGSWLRSAADPHVKIKITDAPAPQLPEK
jgi:hypothetical protein